jgi:hypothetical protein
MLHLAAIESKNILQEEDDENTSLEEILYEEEKEEDMTHPKLGDVFEPLNDDSNTQTQNQLPFIKLHTLFVREFITMRTLFMMMHL